jgi:transcriptional regulator with XRE-family HTH domain
MLPGMTTESIVDLMALVRSALGIPQVDLAGKLGVSRRTGQRWVAGDTGPVRADVGRMAKLVYPVDPTLAGRLAAHAGTTLEALGLVAPPPIPMAPPVLQAPSPPIELLVDSVVCAAAEAINVPPGAVRLALVAAITRARQLGLTLESLESVLGDKA